VCTWSDFDSGKILQSVDNAKNILQRNGFVTQIQAEEERALDRGASILIFGHDSSSINGADELFNKKEFGEKSTTTFMENNLGVDSNLSDMIVTPLSLTKGRSVFTVKQITKHLETNLYITSKITGCKYGIGKIEGGFEVRLEGGSESCI
jgi:RNA 3'-terminal phosphate cyclase (ATP)